MSNLGLIERLADPELIKQMSTSDKLAGAFIVTIMGMLITFAVLLILWGLIAIMTKILYKPVIQQPAVKPMVPTAAPNESPAAVNDTGEDEELVAVITAAIAASMQRPIQTIIVKNIKRSENRMPAWANVAKHEQLDSRRV